MLETGFKQIIVNSADDIKYNKDAEELQLFGAASLTGTTKHGAININAVDINVMSMYMARGEKVGVYDITLAAGSSSLAIGDVVTVSFDFSTMKDQGEFNVNRMVGSDILTFQVILAAATVTGIATAIKNWFADPQNAEEVLRYHIASCTNAGAVLTMTMTTWSVYPKTLILDDETGSATGATYTIATVNTQTNPAPDQGVGLPNIMEEKVQNNTFGNKSAYALRSTAKIDINTRYNVLGIKCRFTSATSNGGSVISGGPAYKESHYIIYVNEDIDLATDAHIISADVSTPTADYLDTAIIANGVTAAEADYIEVGGTTVTPAMEAALMNPLNYLVVRNA